jgi:hypothetical protein
MEPILPSIVPRRKNAKQFDSKLPIIRVTVRRELTNQLYALKDTIVQFLETASTLVQPNTTAPRVRKRLSDVVVYLSVHLAQVASST